MRSDAYIANFELTIITGTCCGKLFPASKGTPMGCKKLQGTSESLTKAFKWVFDMSHFDALMELNNIRMKEGE